MTTEQLALLEQPTPPAAPQTSRATIVHPRPCPICKAGPHDDCAPSCESNRYHT